MKKLLWYKLNLQLFADGAEGVTEAAAGDEGADAGQNNNVNGDNEFSELINGKFKEQFTKKTQEIIDKRFKQTKQLESYKQRVSPVVEKLLGQYGLGEGEEEKLLAALSSKQSENEISEQDKKLVLKDMAYSWVAQGEELKGVFPDFDLRNELQGNKLFPQLLLAGVDLRTAYEVVHKDEILSGAMAYTAGMVREQLVQGIQAKSIRPQENGIIASGAVVSSVDVNALTQNDILKILKKVENGASISF